MAYPWPHWERNQRFRSLDAARESAYRQPGMIPAALRAIEEAVTVVMILGEMLFWSGLILLMTGLLIATAVAAWHRDWPRVVLYLGVYAAILWWDLPNSGSVRSLETGDSAVEPPQCDPWS